jgi:hypothetical protein
MRTLTPVLLSLILLAPALRAHCDGLDGPVVQAARKALEAGDVRQVLIWVEEADEREIRTAFDRALAVRKLGPEARELADRSFFETVVRVHRAGEGEPYTGLKPAGRDLGPAIPAADRAIETGSAAPLVKMLAEAAAHGVQERLRRALEAKRDTREFVTAYVELLHYVEGLHQAVHGPAHSTAH